MAEVAERYPQYEGHWNGWIVVTFTRSVTTKMGRVFEPGDVTVAKLPETRIDPSRFPVAFSARSGVDTAVPASYFRRLTSEEIAAL